MKSTLNIEKNSQIPIEFKKYFWDCDFDDISWETYSFFIAERILQYGNSNSIEWLMNRIDHNLFKKSRNLDKKTINYCEIMLNDNFDAKSKFAKSNLIN